MKVLPFVCIFLICKQIYCEMETFIIGGNYTNIKRYPHSIYLDIFCTAHYICGGSILNQDFVLTAAHCLAECTGRNNIIIKYGHEHLKYMKSIKMHEFKIHDYYNTESIKNDIGIVSCKTPIKLGSNVKRVIIMQNPPTAKYAHVAGWGITNEDLQPSTKLKNTMQKMQPPRACKVLGDVHKGTFCAAPFRRVGSPEQGDSGSALLIKSYIQIGIVSYKVEGFSLVVYTNVSYYYQWIKTQTRKLYCLD